MPEISETEQPPNTHQALSLARMLWKRRMLALLVWVGISAVALVIARLLPPVFKADAVVLVDSQKIPETYVSATVQGDVADRLALISQSVMTSSRLLEIMKAFHLYRRESKSMTQEELLSRMRRDITVSFEKNWTGDRMKAFRLGYQGPDAKIVAEVANRLAGLYVAENVRAREDQAQGTVDFLGLQLKTAKQSLDEQEQKVARFKQEHNGTLPEQETSLLAALSASSTELQGIQASIARAEENKLSLQAALSAAESSEVSLRASQQRDPAGSIQNGVVVRKSEILLEQLRAMRLRYTPDHPNVQALERELMQTRHAEAAAAQAAETGVPDRTKPAGSSPELIQQRERIATLRAQIEVAQHEAASLQKQREEVAASISNDQARISKLPLVEQEMASLKRNYDESATNYNSLLQKQLAAGMATAMERSQKSERFTVIDPARTPELPEKPKRLVIGALGSAAGLVIGLVAGFLLEFRAGTLLGEWELPPGAVVLGRVPLVRMPESTSKAVPILSAVVALCCCKLLSSLVLVWAASGA